MAVGPTRALLAAHFQTSLARSTRELSRQGTWALVFLTVAMGLFVAAPILVGLFMAGYGLGGILLEPGSDWATLGLGALLTLVVGVGGVLGGLLGGSKQLSWEQYRTFPLKTSRLFLAELIAGLGDVLVLALTLALLALLLGLGFRRPVLLPLLIPVFLIHVGLVLSLQLLLGSLAQRLAKRLKLVAGLMLGTVWLASMGMGRLGAAKESPFDPTTLSRFQGLFDGLRHVFHGLPTTQAVSGLEAWLRGQYGTALLLQLYPLAAFLIVAVLAARLLERDKEALAPVDAKGEARLWSFRSAEEGVARLQLRTLLGSHHGKFGFLMPVMTVVLLKGPMSAWRGQSWWALPGAFAYLALFGNQFQFNQFGLDGHGVKSLFLLPLDTRQLLAGKRLGLAWYQSLQAALLVAMLIPLFRPSLLEVLAALALAVCFFLTQSAVGSFTSSWLPRRISRNSLSNNQMPLPLVLVSMGISFGSALIFGGAFALLKWLAPAFLLPGMFLLAGACFGLHRLVMPAAADYLERRREVLVERLG